MNINFNTDIIITLIFIFFIILVSIQFTLNQILRVLKDIRDRQVRENLKNHDKDLD